MSCPLTQSYCRTTRRIKRGKTYRYLFSGCQLSRHDCQEQQKCQFRSLSREKQGKSTDLQLPWFVRMKSSGQQPLASPPKEEKRVASLLTCGGLIAKCLHPSLTATVARLASSKLHCSSRVRRSKLPFRMLQVVVCGESQLVLLTAYRSAILSDRCSWRLHGRSLHRSHERTPRKRNSRLMGGGAGSGVRLPEGTSVWRYPRFFLF